MTEKAVPSRAEEKLFYQGKLNKVYEFKSSLYFQAKCFRRLIDRHFTEEERVFPRKYTPTGTITVTLDEFYDRVWRKDTSRKNFRVQYMVGPGMVRDEKKLLGRAGRAFLPVNDYCVLGNAYNRNYDRKKTLDLYKGLSALYERSDVCAILPQFDLDERQTEYYLRGLSYLTCKSRNKFFDQCMIFR